ncbi:MAG: ABC transporter ATP-binding protein [Candidatus Methanoplasma sp.]|jgi:ABC-2 type transport system ATP-binding protein|nr:ABC transporter ATP-binding protein [Candidatus Methanoplasma sp.]
MLSSGENTPAPYQQLCEEVIRAEKIVVKFGENVAVDHVDVNVKRGEIYGFLGPNGAGKTTTIRVLTTLLHPTSGDVTVNGFKIPSENKKIRRMIGFVQQMISLDKDISVKENIICHGYLQKVPKKDIQIRMERISAVLGLTPFLNYTVIKLSGGWKRKTAIACALMHDPKILFLDEPTAGLDTQSRHMLWDMIRQLNSAGTTIFLTTHYIEEAENLCDRVAILNKGKRVALGSPKELCDKIGRFAVEYDGDNHVRKYRYFSDWDDAKKFVATFGDSDSVLLRRTTLEDVFLEMTGREVTTDFVKVVRI